MSLGSVNVNLNSSVASICSVCSLHFSCPHGSPGCSPESLGPPLFFDSPEKVLGSKHLAMQQFTLHVSFLFSSFLMVSF